MLDLQVLVKTQSNLKAKRDSQGDNLCQQGFVALAQAEESGFESKGELKRALNLFIQAIRQNRQYIPSYLGLAYILSLLGQHDQAKKYINMALSISPEDPDAQEMQRYLASPYEYTPDPPEEATEASPEALFDQLERQVYSLLQASQTYPLKWTLVEQDKFAEHQTTYAQLDQEYQDCQEQLKVVSETFQTLNLQNLLENIKSHLDTYVFQMALMKRLKAKTELAHNLSKEMTQAFKDNQKTPDTEIHTKLENWHESVDKLAVDITSLKQEEVEVSVLEGQHQRLVTLLESFEDYLEFN